MKSLTKLDWTLAGFMATHYALELLELDLGSPKISSCFKYFSFPALVKARGQLQDMIAIHGVGEYSQETRAVDIQLVSASGGIGIVEIRGCLLVNRVREPGRSHPVLTSVFRLRLTCHCRPNPESNGHNQIHLELADKPLPLTEGLPALKRLLQGCSAPFQLQITDFDYEAIY